MIIMAVKFVRVADVKVGDEVLMAGGDWSFRVGSIDEGRTYRRLRDANGVARREPSPYDDIAIWVPERS
jgi:pyruvate kinase